MHPLFPDDPQATQHPAQGGDYMLDRQKHKQIKPERSNPAADLIRAKLNALYENEPDAKTEITEVSHIQKPQRSKYQQFMYELSTSGKPLARIQQEWHDYYAQLPDHEKHEVWREFYAANSSHSPIQPKRTAPQPDAAPKEHGPAPHHQPAPKPHVITSQYRPESHPPKKKQAHPKQPSLAAPKRRILQKVRGRVQAQHKAKQHLKSLAVGVTFGLLAVIILLFSFLNEVVVARLIQPGGPADTPIILATDGIAPSDQPELIIPKINVQLPVVYDIPSTQEEVIQEALDNGVAHYPTTVHPGERGNAAFFGHSSNNIFNSGDYKFAFALLRHLVPGDIFYITYEGQVYTYRVYDKRVVAPDETWVLGNAPGKHATAALITCDPPGTTINRLVVWGEQITPDPTDNTEAEPPAPSEAAMLPAQGPTLWGRLWTWVTGS
jgi:LPXTG-site transpeptidase (sortase) family protein